MYYNIAYPFCLTWNNFEDSCLDCIYGYSLQEEICLEDLVIASSAQSSELVECLDIPNCEICEISNKCNKCKANYNLKDDKCLYMCDLEVMHCEDCLKPEPIFCP